jgi:IMP dehydrogenase
LNIFKRLFTPIDSEHSLTAKQLRKHINKTKVALTFDDILLEPQYSTAKSRTWCNTTASLGNCGFQIPIVAANMSSVCDYDMSKAMYRAGGVGILHRYVPHETILKWTKDLHTAGYPVFPSVGVKDIDFELAKELILVGVHGICIDIAHGDSEHMIQMIKKIKNFNSSACIIAGNVATFGGAMRLAQAGANVIKCGIGPGSNCSTRTVTGHGVPQVSAILDIVRVKDHYPVQVIADGGIKNSGDIVKSLALGADLVMLGSLLAGTKESAGEEVNGYKIYRGMASREAREKFFGKLNNYTAEGVESKRKIKGTIRDVMVDLAGGIRSGLSYSGAYTISDLQKEAKFIIMTGSGMAESQTHSGE